VPWWVHAPCRSTYHYTRGSPAKYMQKPKFYNLADGPLLRLASVTRLSRIESVDLSTTGGGYFQLPPALLRNAFEWIIGARHGALQVGAPISIARSRRRDLPPIPIENSRKSQIAAELPHLHP
jgi:hypothetical protein